MTKDIQEYRSKKVVIRFDAAKCIHSRHCVLGNPKVFIANAPGEWIQPDAASPEEIAALLRACPSGALTYERLDGSGQESAPLVNTMHLRVEGNLEVCSGTGRTLNRTQKTWLCRCGASQNKPFCDGTHRKIGFAT